MQGKLFVALNHWIEQGAGRGQVFLPLDVLVFRRSRADAKRFDVALELGRGDALESPLLPAFELTLGELFQAG